MIGDVFILKFNKFFIWVVLIVGVITIDFNYLQKDVEASSPISTFLVSTRPKEYNKFKENFGSDEENLLKSVSDYCYFPYFFNGKWNERGEKSLKEWAEEFENFFNNIHENENVILLDCHR